MSQFYNWPQKCFCTSAGWNALGKPTYLDITPRSAGNGVVDRYFKRPSIGTVTTLRIALFNQTSWRNDRSVGITATDCSGGSVLSLAHLANDFALRMTWQKLVTTFTNQGTALEVEGLRNIVNTNSGVIPNLIYVLSNLHTVRVQPQDVAEGCEVLHDILPGAVSRG